MYSNNKSYTIMKNDCTILIRMPKHIKDAFQKQCEEELMDMSVKVRQLILKELKSKPETNGKQ